MLDADDRETWVNADLDLRELGDVGHDLWMQWGATSSKFNTTDAEHKWQSFRDSRSGYANIFAKARALGWRPEPIEVSGDFAKTADQVRAELAAEAIAKASPAPWLAGVSKDGADFVVVDLFDFDSMSIPVQAHAIGGIAPRGEVTLFAGHGGSGKSTLAMTLAAHYAAQRPFGPFHIDGGRCAYVSLEDPAPVNLRRLKAIRDRYHLSAKDIAKNLCLVDGSIGDGALAREINTLGIRTLAPTPNLARMRTQVEGCGLIIIDNSSDAFDGDEINRSRVRAFVRMLKTIARENDAAVVLLAHIDKAAAKNGSNGNSYSGSTAWHNSVRSRLALVEEKGVLELRHEKSNLGPRAETLALRFADGGVLVPVAPDDAPAAAPVDDAALLHCLADAVAAGENISTSRQGAFSTFTCAKTLRGFPAGLRASRLFWESLGRLDAAGLIVRDPYTNDNRKTRERWIVAPNAPNAEK